MENNEKPLNPIARARQQANINKNKTHGVNPGDIDVFGNTEPIKTKPVMNDSTFSTPVFNESFEEETPLVVAEEERVYTIGGDGVEELLSKEKSATPATQEPAPQVEPVKQDTIIQPINRVEPIISANTQEVNELENTEPITPLNLEQEEMTMVSEPVEEVTATEPVVQEKPKKEKKEKPVRIIRENEIVITPESIKEGRKIAWLAYILFFIPLLINKSNAYVRHNANEGLEIFIFDVLASILLILNAVVNTANFLVSSILLVGSLIGIVLFILTTITKIYMIVVCLLGKVVQTPWCWKFKIIK